MTLHIFNPEHDIALASGLSNFTAPHAGRQLRHDLGFLPAIWAHEDDIIVVDNPEYAALRWKRLIPRLVCLGEARGYEPGTRRFLSWKQLQWLRDVTIEPWGWNSALRALLLRSGVKDDLLPTTESLATIRELSHRRVASSLLPQLRLEGTVGESFECRTAEEVETLLAKYGRLVLKAPWSSSGRGVRFCDAARLNDKGEMINENWARNVMASQGSVMAEPYYNKVKDFGMEFESDGEGSVRYLGLSLFQTQNGAYTGNVLATETVKEEIMSRFLSPSLLKTARETICRQLGALFQGRYKGPFGVDMMVVRNDDMACLLHPCVEINLRRTMGHVALALSPNDDDIRRVMRISIRNGAYILSCCALPAQECQR